MIGEPIPYSLSTDNLLLVLYLANILGVAYVFIVNGANIADRTKSLFYYSNQSNPYNTRAGISRFCSFILIFQIIFFLSIIAFNYLLLNREETINRISHIYFLSFAALFTLFLFVKRIMYDIVNNILFTAKLAKEWRDSYFFTIKLTGFLLFPLVTAIIFKANLSEGVYWTYLVFVAIIYLYMLSVRALNIIFVEKLRWFDIFLYLCAIELLPIGILCKTIAQTISFLTIKL